MGFVKRYGNNADYRRRLEVKLQKSTEHIEELAEWLYVHTSDIESTEYERRYAEYNSELRRHDIFSDELQCYDTRPSLAGQSGTMARPELGLQE